MNYEYTNKDLLKFPQKYQQSLFQGKEFLNSYFKNREEIIEKIKKNGYDFKNLQNIETELIEKMESTKNDLEKKFIKIIINKNLKKDLPMDQIVDTFLKKFEIKKMIALEYDSNNKEKSKNFRYLRNYLLLSILCCLKYKETKNLKFLNTVLKINDTLVSQFFAINEKLDFKIFSIILQMEINFIKELYNSKGVKIN
jgi:hypothetical protein